MSDHESMMEVPSESTGSADDIRSRRDQLIEEYRQYVESVVGRLIQTLGLPRHLRSEFVSAGYLGLVEAAERFDHERGSEFRVFAFLRIRGAIIDSIRRCCEVSHRAYRLLQALEAAQDMRLEELHTGRSQGPHISRTRVTHALEYLSRSSLSFRLAGLSNKANLSQEEVPEEEIDGSDPEQELYMRQESERIQKILATLPDKERLILEQYYFHGQSLVEIAENHAGLSKSWVSRLHIRGVELLRARYLEQVGESGSCSFNFGGVQGRNNSQSPRSGSKPGLKQTGHRRVPRRKD